MIGFTVQMYCKRKSKTYTPGVNNLQVSLTEGALRLNLGSIVFNGDRRKSSKKANDQCKQVLSVIVFDCICLESILVAITSGPPIEGPSCF